MINSSMPSLTLQDTLHGVPGADRPLPVGYRLQGFELQGLIARHDITDTHRAMDNGLDAEVVIEEYMPRLLARRDALGRIAPAKVETAAIFRLGLQVFIEESRSLARCDHPSLLKVVHLFESNGTAYRVMPVYQGLSLADVRRSMSGPPDEAGLRSLLDGLLGALHTYHVASGTAHGKVHPHHVLLLEDDTPLLLSPDAAQRVCAAKTKGESVIDAASAVHADVSADLRAVALLARFCISGEELPPASNGSEPVDETLTTLVSQLFFDRPQLPYAAGFLRALDAALSDQIGERPRSAQELSEWLHRGPPRVLPLHQTLSEAENDAIQRVVSSVSRPADMNDLVDASRPPPPLTEFLGRDALPSMAAHKHPPPHASATTTSTTAPSSAPMPKEMSSLAAQSLAAAAAWEDTVAEPRAFGRATSPSASSSAAAAQTAPQSPRLSSFTTPMPEPDYLGFGSPESTAHIQLDDDFLRSSPAPASATPSRLASGQPRKFAAMWGFVALGLAVVLALAVWQWMVVPAIEVPTARGLPSVTPEQATTGMAAPQAVAPVASAVVLSPSVPNPASGSAAKNDVVNPFSGLTSSTTVVSLPEAASAVPAVELAPKVPLSIIEPPVDAKRLPPRPVAVKATSPRQLCGSRTEFSLYRCMQTQCVQAQWSKHPQCLTLKETDEVVN
jgi:hypothetical protein